MTEKVVKRTFSEFGGLKTVSSSDEPLFGPSVSKKAKISSSPQKKSHFIIENIGDDVSVDDIKRILKKGNIEMMKGAIINTPMAQVVFNKKKDLEKCFNNCQGARYKSKELHLFRAKLKDNGQIDNDDGSNFDKKSVHLKNLSETVTNQMILKYIESQDKVENLTVNAMKKTAIAIFTDSESAENFISKINGVEIEGKVISASFLLKSLKAESYILSISNVPTNAKKSEIKEAFPKCSKVKVNQNKKCNCLVYFKTLEDYDSYLYREDLAIKGSVVKIEPLMMNMKSMAPKNIYLLNIFNLPFDITISELKSHFKDANGYQLNKNNEGQCNGTATLKFHQKEDCEDMLKLVKTLKIRERKLRSCMEVENQVGKN